MPCAHPKLVFSTSCNASEAGYTHPALTTRIAATTAQVPRESTATKNLAFRETESLIFPAPLVLPEDELSCDPSYPAQSLKSWVRLKSRNKVTAERRTVYLARPPEAEAGLEFIQKWIYPRVKGSAGLKEVTRPTAENVLSYLGAFYHGLPVKTLPSPPLCFTADVDDDTSDPKNQTLWLNTQTESGCVGIRTRATPKADFTHQLNVNDLLDAAMEILPNDAYALLLLVDHDIYEDEEDEFACGRAYGGSRIAVVSTARYNPILDDKEGLEREHAWPASHCEKYVEECCNAADAGIAPKKKKAMAEKVTVGGKSSVNINSGVASPMKKALLAHTSLPSLDHSPSSFTLSGLWLGRVCRTASHELGHCFGIDHCTYYACCMQGTRSLAEDARQPPYLCPVDLAKILRATGADATEHYAAMLAFCEKNMHTHLFAAYQAWIRGRNKEIKRFE